MRRSNHHDDPIQMWLPVPPPWTHGRPAKRLLGVPPHAASVRVSPAFGEA